MRSGYPHGTTFAGEIRTDGVQVQFSFARLPSGPEPPLLYSQDLRCTGPQTQGFCLSGTDLGRRTVVTTSFGSGADEHDIRQVSTREYRTVTKEKSRQYHLERLKSKPLPGQEPVTMASVESSTPTTTTADPTIFRSSVRDKLQNLQRTFDFYDKSHSEARFEAYKGKQRGPAYVANVMTTGFHKYNKAKRTKRKTRKNRRRRAKQKKKNNNDKC